MSNDYLEPLASLLSLKMPNERNPDHWIDYRTLGIGDDHIGDLLRMMSDPDLNTCETDAIWAPVHALRALGQLHPTDVFQDLLEFMTDQDHGYDIDWFFGDAEFVLAMFGPSVIPSLQAFLMNDEIVDIARMTAASALAEIAKRFPDTRTECIAALMHRLDHFNPEDGGLNGSVALTLGVMKAVDAYPAIKAVYEANAVDAFFFGDLEDREIQLGLREQRSKASQLPAGKRTSMGPSPFFSPFHSSMPTIPLAPRDEVKAKKKAKRKLAQSQRKRNRSR